MLINNLKPAPGSKRPRLRMAREVLTGRIPW